MRGDRGSTLMLMPAAVLVFLVLGAIGADLSHSHMARAGLEDLAATIANDVSTAGLNTAVLRDNGAYELDTVKASGIAQRLVAAQSRSTLRDITIDPFAFTTAPDGSRSLTIVLRARVDHIFGRGVPFSPDSMAVSAQSTVTLRDQQ